MQSRKKLDNRRIRERFQIFFIIFQIFHTQLSDTKTARFERTTQIVQTKI